MRKSIIYYLGLIIGVLLFASTIASENQIEPIRDTITSKDTLIYAKTIIMHPTAQDSVLVKTIVEGAVKWVSVPIKNPIINTFLSDPNVKNYISGFLVAGILGIWRRIELRRLRKKGLLKDKA